MKRKIINCIVINNKMEKTIKVLIKVTKKNLIYKKIIKNKKKILVHDENNSCNIGDLIEIKEFKPISKKKSWIFSKLIKKSKNINDTRTN